MALDRGAEELRGCRGPAAPAKDAHERDALVGD